MLSTYAMWFSVGFLTGWISGCLMLRLNYRRAERDKEGGRKK